MNSEQLASIEDLRRRYPLTESVWKLAGREWRMTAAQDQDALLRKVTTDEELENFPYGLALWASALGLAERLIQEPALVYGKRVLEIGAGAGFAGIIARSLGAEVVQTDYQADALALCRYNAAANGVSGVAVCKGDWRDFPPDLGAFDLVIGSDILYERTLHSSLIALFPRLIAPEGTILLSDPLRPQAFDFVQRWEAGGGRVSLESATTFWEGKPKEIALFCFRSVSK